jgi:hypothetical protein
MGSILFQTELKPRDQCSQRRVTGVTASLARSADRAKETKKMNRAATSTMSPYELVRLHIFLCTS